jgi:response regulator RpfG family c-di-GMP phosphodiesterase
MSEQSSKVTGNQAFTVLFVDDETNILSALGRLFQPTGFKLVFAENAAQAMGVFASEPIDVVITDMRMPGLTGAQLLSEVSQKYPGTYRILLTGFGDINAAVGALNDGGIYRYLSKPWIDEEILGAVRDAIKLRGLEREKERLQNIAFKRNEELRDFNINLEKKVAERNAEAMKVNEALNLKLVTAVKVFSNLIELRGGILAGHAKRVSDMSVQICKALKLPKDKTQDVMLGALLHDIGKIGFQDILLAKPIAKLSMPEVKIHRTHPDNGNTALMALEDFKEVTLVVKHHHELWDGTGFPDNLAGENIPLSARIVAVANDYDSMLQGTLGVTKYKPDQAAKAIQKGKGRRYDPAVVDAFQAVLDGGVQSDDEKLVKQTEVRAGMKLNRDVYNSNGVLLVSAGHELDEFYAKKLQEYENPDLSTLKIWIYIEPPPEEEQPEKPGNQTPAAAPDKVVPDPEGNKAFLT